MIQVIEHCARIVRQLVAQGAHQGARIHGRLQALAADVADHNEERIVLQRQDLKEVAADAVDGQVGALKHEILVGRKLGGNQQSLYAAGGGDLGGGALLDLTDANEAVEDDGNQAGEKDDVGDGAGVKCDGTEMEVMRSELFGQPVAARGVVDNGVGRVGDGGEEEGEEHDAGFLATAAPGAEEQHADEGAEDDFSGNRENLVDLFPAGNGEDRQKEYADLYATNEARAAGWP